MSGAYLLCCQCDRMYFTGEDKPRCPQCHHKSCGRCNGVAG